LGAIHARWRTPYIAIIVSSIAAFGFAMASDLLTALTMSTAARIVAYILSCMALIRLSRRADAPAAGFNLPARVPLAILTILIFTGVMVLGAQKELIPLLAFTAVGFMLFFVMRRRAA
jgi:amino acid transporter